MSDCDPLQKTSLEKLLQQGPLSEDQALTIYEQGKEAVVFALLKLSAELQKPDIPSPSTPSGMIPPYKKPEGKKRGKKPGRKKGHKGAHRKPPLTIHKHKKHTMEICPYCNTRLTAEPSEYRKRIIEDIPGHIEPVVTEHTIPRTYCPTCEKIVEPPVDEALPKANIGNHLAALTAWLHYGLGTTISQIIAVLSSHLHVRLTKGGLVNIWHILAHILDPWYEQLAGEIQDSAVLHIDETGWRVKGKTYWLWCFATKRATFYLIDKCRGSPVLQEFFAQEFAGVLITDFWGAYNRLNAALRQVCLVHLFRELKKVQQYKDCSEDWPAFSKKLKRLMKDALRLEKRSDIGAKKFESLKNRLYLRLDNIIQRQWKNTNVRRLIKRLRRHRDDMFTFLDHEDVPSDNNHAEREIRPAVIMRKNIYANRSTKGAHTQAVLMSVYRTLKLRNHDLTKTIAASIATYIRTGTLPPLPE